MEDCIIKTGARIGGSGFGFEMKTKHKVYHNGINNWKKLIYGSNTTIDRAVLIQLL